MLGYRGRTGRREFFAGSALLYVGTAAFSMAVKGALPWIFAAFERPVAVAIAIGLTILTCAAIVLWFWGWTVLATRRARDIGLPAWAGVLSLVALVAIGRWTTSLPDPASAILGWGIIVVWIAAVGAAPTRLFDRFGRTPEAA